MSIGEPNTSAHGGSTRTGVAEGLLKMLQDLPLQRRRGTVSSPGGVQCHSGQHLVHALTTGARSVPQKHTSPQQTGQVMSSLVGVQSSSGKTSLASAVRDPRGILTQTTDRTLGLGSGVHCPSHVHTL